MPCPAKWKHKHIHIYEGGAYCGAPKWTALYAYVMWVTGGREGYPRIRGRLKLLGFGFGAMDDFDLFVGFISKRVGGGGGLTSNTLQ